MNKLSTGEIVRAGDLPLWIRPCLRAAGVYNIAWGMAVIAWPQWLFDFASVERMNYPEIWQCVGMIVGVYGVGYWLAASDVRTQWPIVLVGLLGKVLGPMGFLVAVWRGRLPLLFGATLLTNDVIWWVPFSMILWKVLAIREPNWAPLSHSKSRA